MKIAMRNAIAGFFRTLPYFKGKYRLGPVLIPLLTNYEVDRDCLVTIKMRDGSKMRLDLRSFIEQRAFFSGEYDGGVIYRISKIIKAESTVFDVGANIGFYSLAIANKMKQSKIWAFEPVLSNYNRLVEITEMNNLKNRVYPVNMALGDREGDISLKLAEQSNKATTGNAFWLKGSLAETINPTCSARITKLDSFVKENKIEQCDFIKVDIEGAEMEFLRGGSDFINRCRPILYGEFNKYWVEEFGYTFVDIANLVRPWEYKLYEQKGRKNFVEIKEPEVGIENVMMIPKEKLHSTLEKLGV